MGGFGGFNEKKKKKQKQNQKSGASGMMTTSKPQYVMPTVIKPERKEK